MQLERVEKVAMSGEFLDVGEVAALLRVRPVTIYRWCRAGRLAGIKIGKEWRIPRATVAALLRASGWERALGRSGEGGSMNEVSPASAALARRLLLYETGGHPEPAALIAAAGRVHGRLRGRLMGVIGVIGFATLFTRARHLAQSEFPALAQLAFEEGVAAPPAAVAGTAESATVAAGVTAVFANFIGLLGTFIGEDLALRLSRDAWHEVSDEAFVRAGTEGAA